MTATDVQTWLEAWRLRLCPEWRVHLEFPLEADGDKRAQVQRADHYHTAVVRLFPRWEAGWPEGSPPGSPAVYEVEVALVHELLHVCLRDADFVMGQARDEWLSFENGKWLELAWEHAEEAFVERLARTFVDVASVR